MAQLLFGQHRPSEHDTPLNVPPNCVRVLVRISHANFVYKYDFSVVQVTDDAGIAVLTLSNS